MQDFRKAFTTIGPCDSSLRAHVAANPPRPYPPEDYSFARNSGWIQTNNNSLSLSQIGSGNYVRAKFYIYRGGQSDPQQANLIPTIRMRVQTRYICNSMLEVDSCVDGFPGLNGVASDIRPSSDPDAPSLYRVDLDPIEVPHMVANPNLKVASAAFEAFSNSATENGFLAMSEAQVLVVPPPTPVPGNPAKVYTTSGSDAGDLKLTYSGSSCMRFNLRLDGGYNAGGVLPVVTEGTAGVTIDSGSVPYNQIGIATLDFSPDRGADAYAQRIRVAPAMQYHVKFHLSSTQNTNAQSQIRMRSRTLKYAWSQKLEIGGAWALGQSLVDAQGNPNHANVLAQQILPGVGNQTGGWYTLIMHTPLSPGIRSEFQTGTPLATSMPSISSQPGQGVQAASHRDLLVGLDVIDSMSYGDNNNREQTLVTIDRVEVHPFTLVAD